MSRIAYILLCHKEPEASVAQANRLTAAGDYISIHFDARADSQSFVAIKDALSENPNVAFARKRIKCGWGAWSLVQATLYAIEAAVDAFPKATHFYMISDYGMPATFYNDHYEFLVGQDSLFARKISAGATSLRQRLGALYNSNRRDFQTASDGKNLYQFVTERGRTGLRFAPRFWELESTIGRDRELFVIVCKKWHIAKRFVQQLQQRTQMPLLEYIFSEDVKELPELGGILSNQQKKGTPPSRIDANALRIL